MRFGDIDISLKNGITILNKSAVKTETYKNVITERQLFRFNADLGKWRNAILYAESVDSPNRIELIRVFQEVTLDNHLTSVLNSRTEKVLSHKFLLVDQNGEVNQEATMILQKSWFLKFIKLALDSKWWGYSLIQFDDLEDLSFGVTEIVPREYVEPKMSIVKQEPSMTSGIRYDQEPVNVWSFFVGSDDLGILNQIAPVAIWKKNAFGSWAEFVDTFGIPPRIGRTDVRDTKNRQNMLDMLANMGRMAYGVFDHDDKIDLIDPKHGDAWETFDKLIERANSEMSKNITGGTMTADDGSSRSQAEVHERGFDVINRGDLRWVENLMNERFLSWLITNHNFPFEGLTFKYDQTESLSLTDQKDIIKELLPHYHIPADWINDRFGVPVTEKQSESSDQTDPESFFFKSIRREIFDQYASFKMEHEPDHLLSEEDEAALYAGIFAGTINLKNLPVKLYEATAKLINDFVIKGFGGDVTDFPIGSEPRKMLVDLKNNVFRFSGGKTFHNVREMQAELKDAAGNFRPFEVFKEEAQKVYKEFNVHHLKAEYETARSQAEAAETWMRFQDQKDVFPLATYRTQLDNRVRIEHQELEGITARLDSDFWATNWIPNGYHCRCFPEQRTADVRETELKDLTAIQMKNFDSVDPVFRMNSGIDRKIFSQKHPYFKAPKGFKEQRDKNHNLPIPQDV
jgi:SPP1 gp7 family putative phage head morphogenesis protein